MARALDTSDETPIDSSFGKIRFFVFMRWRTTLPVDTPSMYACATGNVVVAQMPTPLSKKSMSSRYSQLLLCNLRKASSSRAQVPVRVHPHNVPHKLDDHRVSPLCVPIRCWLCEPDLVI